MSRRHGWCAWLLLLPMLSACNTIENRLIYHPASLPATAEATPAPWQDVEFLGAKGERLHGRWYVHPQAHGAILVCPGNTGNLAERMALAKKLGDTLEESVLIFDYPGFGKSEGTPSEQTCYDSATAAYDWLTKERKIAGTHVVLFGQTLGAAVATDLASRKPHRALVLVSPFTSLPDLTEHQLPILPASYLMSSRFDALAKIGQCPQPIFVAHGDCDEVVPIGQGKRLVQAVKSDKEWFVMKGIGNSDRLPYEFFVSMKAFVQRKTALPWQ